MRKKFKFGIIINTLILAIIAIASVFCVNLIMVNANSKKIDLAFGNENGDYGIALTAMSGDGSQNNPYIVDSSDDLTYMATQCNNNAGNYRTAYYRQVCNLTCPSSWTMIDRFNGTYDGCGYTISGLTTSSKDFAFINVLDYDSVFKNVGFTNVNYNIKAKGTFYSAVIAIDSYGELSNCFVTGKMNYDIENGTEKRVYVGAVTSYIGAGTISNCFNAANIYLDGTGVWTTTHYVAGIACEVAGGSVVNCYNIGTLEIDSATYWALGGISAKDEGGGTLYNCATLENSCKKSGSNKNGFFNRYTGSTNISTSNCGVISAASLKNSGAAPLSSWEWNASTVTPRVWGFPDSSSPYYNNGYPQLRVFYENFNVNVYNEAGNQLLSTKTTRYPDYAVNLSDVSIPYKRGYTHYGKFTSNPNSTGISYTHSITSIYSSFNVYVAYEVNYYRLKVTNPTPLAGNVSTKDEMVAFDSVVTLTATSNPGYRFVEFRYVADDSVASDQNPCVFNMPDMDIIAYAYYMEETYAVKTYINNSEFGSVTGQNDYFKVGQTVTLTATPKTGYKVSKFYLSDGTILSTNSSYTFTMPRENRNIYVDFEPIQYSVTIQAYPSGVANVTGGGLYKYGSEVDLRFSNVASGYKFASWKLNNVNNLSFSADEVAKFTIPASNSTIYCYFVESSQNYVGFVDMNGSVVAEHIVNDGASVAMQPALEVAGYEFLGWYNNGVKVTSLSNLTESVVLEATYEKIFDCEVEVSILFKDESYSTSENATVFFSLKDAYQNNYNASVDIVSQLRFSLINYGSYALTYVLPTYYNAQVYVNYELNNSSSFEIDLYEELVVIQFVVYKSEDAWLYDSNFKYGKDNIDDDYYLNPVIQVGEKEEYIGMEQVINNFDFNNFTDIPVSPHGYALKDIIGGTNWGGLYNFTSDNYLVEGANFVGKDMGSTVYKVSLANHYKEMYPFNTDWGTTSINNMTDLAKSKPYKELFENPNIKTYVLVAYEFVYCPWERVLTNAYTLSDMEIYYAMVRKEFEDLTKYLLSTYSQAGKTFILSNWEGDNAYGAYYDLCTTDAQRQLLTDSYVGYINARQDGIIAGRKGLIITSKASKVYGNFEVNHIGQNIPNVPNRWRLVDVAVPKTYCDLYSISDWYSYLKDSNGNYMFPIENLLNQLYSAAQNNLSYTNPSQYPASAYTAGKNIMITEFGYDENTDSEFYSKLTHEVKKAVEWGVYKLVYWGIYSNVKYSTGSSRPTNEEVQGLWLIKPEGDFSKAFWYFKSLISGKDYVNKTPNIIYRFNSDAGIDWEYNKSKIIFKDDLTNSSKFKNWSSNNISFYNIDPAGDSYYYFQEFNYHYGSVDTTGIIQTSDDNSLKYISYDMHSNKFGILLYSYNNYLNYVDLNGNPIESLVIIEGKTKSGSWEKIENVGVKQYMASRADGNLYWIQNYLSATVEDGRYSELRIVFANKNYNSWDPIISSVVFFEGGAN